MFVCLLSLQGHPDGAQGGQREAEAAAEEPATFYRGAEEGAD